MSKETARALDKSIVMFKRYFEKKRIGGKSNTSVYLVWMNF